jgi:hypothetical protein
MGVTILTSYPLQTRTGAECIEELSKRLLALGAIPAGQFLVDGDIFDNGKSLLSVLKVIKLSDIYLSIQ